VRLLSLIRLASRVTHGPGSAHYGAVFPAFVTTILFSLSAVFAHRTARMIGGTEANFWRLACATLLLATWAYLFGEGLRGVAFPYFLASGVVGFGISDLALFQSLPRLGSRLSILLVQCLAAPFAALTEWLWLGTTLGTQQIWGGVIILLGVALALAPSGHLALTPAQRRVGTAFGILAALGQGGGAVLSRKAYQVAALANEPIDGITAAYQRIIGGVLLAGIFLLIVKRGFVRAAIHGASSDQELSPKWKSLWYWILFNALAGPALGVSFFQWALKTAPTGVVLPIVAITPIVVIPFARVMEGERPGIRSLIGGMIAVIGAVILALAAR
jgi:drug/metabolite transporter (DMT)-like permease